METLPVQFVRAPWNVGPTSGEQNAFIPSYLWLYLHCIQSCMWLWNTIAEIKLENLACSFSTSSSLVPCILCFLWLGHLNLNRIKANMRATHSIGWKHWKQLTSLSRNTMVSRKLLRRRTHWEKVCVCLQRMRVGTAQESRVQQMCQGFV